MGIYATPMQRTLKFVFYFIFYFPLVDVLVIFEVWGVNGGGGGEFIHWSLQFALTWRLLYRLADTKSNENTDRSSMLAISNSLISIP